LSENRNVSESVTMNISSVEAAKLFAKLHHARNKTREAIRSGYSAGEIGFCFGWLDQYLTELSNKVPAYVVKQVHNDTRVKEGLPPVIAGGGAKPD